MLTVETLDRPEAATDEWLRLGVRIVVSGRDGANSQAVLQQVLALFWPSAELYDFYATPYPRLPEATVLRIAFDLPASYAAGVSGIVQSIGGSGWTVDIYEDGEQAACWKPEHGALRPLCEHFHSAEINLIPSSHLAAFRKSAGPRLLQ
ncbi:MULTISPECIES: hypothetical protein [unclassified Massilia]|uniref:hypothetical protein n=1 Tax=unclassified Massilia TaxID=2609279 RepID=UPI00064AACB8|nr:MULTISPECIES: hypothetical protein [unclassified Massilia]ALK97489.1 hypothetical protein AM586_15940 [Massilia sp. WG5]